MLRKLYWIFFLSAIIHGLSAASEVSLIIDTQQASLTVKSGRDVVLVLDNISIGRNGAGYKSKVGDDVTPLGNYRISWVNNKSPYYRFYGFNYPSRTQAKLAFNRGLIDARTYQRIERAHDEDIVPPQNTPLGGRIGIHGLGKADERIHRMMNWTHGCIALTNDQIDLLQPWVSKGTWVLVK